MGLTVVPHCPSKIRAYADRFKDLVAPGPDYQSFVASLCGAVFGVGGLCSTNRFLMFSPSVSSLSNFYANPSLSKDLNRRQRQLLKPLFQKIMQDPGRFQWAIDDTLIKKSGQKIWGTYWWWDHKSNSSVLAQKLLCVGIVDTKRQVFFPVKWEVLHRKESENRNCDHEKGWERSIALLKEFYEEYPLIPKITVVADSWFGGEEFFQKLDKMGFSFVVEVRSNRKIEAHSQTKLDVRVDNYFANKLRSNIHFHTRRKWGSEAILRLKDSQMKLKVVGVANQKSLADKCFGFYVTNKLTWNASKVWGISRNRWAIEVQFRDLKQIFTLSEAALRSLDAVETHLSVVMIAMTVIRLEQCARVGAKEDQYVRPNPAGDIVRELMLENLQQGFHKLAHQHLGKALREKISKKINRQNLNGKPAEERGKKQMPYSSMREAA